MGPQAPEPARRARALQRVGGPGSARPASVDAQLIGFTEELRGEGVAIGTSELLDAFAALGEVPWTVREDFKEALAATLAKSPEDRRVFDLVFDRFFFRAAEAEAAVQGVTEGEGFEGADQIDVDALREQIAAALQEGGTEGAMRDLARLAIAAFGERGEGSGVIGVDVQRIRRSLGLQSQGRGADGSDVELDREQINRFERHLRRELERALIERTEKLPPSRPLAELDRALPTS